MKPKLYIFLLIGFSCSLFVACKSASKLYQKGNYNEAVELAAKKLQKDPDDQKLLAILREAYQYALNDHEARIRTAGESNRELKWESMYAEYASLQRMYDAIYRVPSVFQLIRPNDYSSFLVTYGEKAAEVRFERGMAHMQQYAKQSYRNAYREFQAAAKFQPDNRAINNKMQEAFEYAVTNVVILPMHQQGGFVYSSYRVGGNNFDDEIIRDLQYSSGNEFVRFYSAWDARSQRIRVDQEVDIQLSRLDIGHYYDRNDTRRVSKDVLVKETVYRPDSVVREYAKVYATITSTRRTMSSNASIRIQVRDAEGRWLWNDLVHADHNWTTDFASFTGDTRALSEADKELVNRRKEFAPGEQEIVQCLLNDINNTARYRIRNYFISQF